MTCPHDPARCLDDVCRSSDECVWPAMEARMSDVLLRILYPGEPSPGIRVKHAGRWWEVGEHDADGASWAVRALGFSAEEIGRVFDLTDDETAFIGAQMDERVQP